LNNTQVFFLNTILVHFSWYVILYIFLFFSCLCSSLFPYQAQYSHENVQVEGTNTTKDPELGSKGSAVCTVSSFFLPFWPFLELLHIILFSYAVFSVWSTDYLLRTWT
jgi:hypothetical protein